MACPEDSSHRPYVHAPRATPQCHPRPAISTTVPPCLFICAPVLSGEPVSTCPCPSRVKPQIPQILSLQAGTGRDHSLLFSFPPHSGLGWRQGQATLGKAFRARGDCPPSPAAPSLHPAPAVMSPPLQCPPRGPWLRQISRAVSRQEITHWWNCSLCAGVSLPHTPTPWTVCSPKVETPQQQKAWPRRWISIRGYSEE